MSTLCQYREAGSVCRRMADHDGDHDLAPDTSDWCPWMLTNPAAAGALRCRLAAGHDGACLPPATRGQFNDADWLRAALAGEGAADQPQGEPDWSNGVHP